MKFSIVSFDRAEIEITNGSKTVVASVNEQDASEIEMFFAAGGNATVVWGEEKNKMTRRNGVVKMTAGGISEEIDAEAEAVVFASVTSFINEYEKWCPGGEYASDPAWD